MLFARFKERSVLAAAVGLTLANRVAVRARLRPRVDGWRRAAGLVLRGEASTFILSAFGLDVWSGVERPPAVGDRLTRERFARRIDEFLRAEPAACRRVVCSQDEDRAEACDAPRYSLRFEPAAEGPERFIPPETWLPSEAREAGDPVAGGLLMNLVCRPRPDGSADLWARVNHVGADGVPIQEALTRLEAAWGSTAPVLYPDPTEFAAHSTPRACPGRPNLAQVQAFIDFGPLLAWRKQQNALLPEPMTISAAILWRLALHPAFAELFMGTTVEVAANGNLEPGVGVVVVRPSDFAAQGKGLGGYVRWFNRQVERTRRRATGACATLDAAALVPPRLAEAVIRFALEQGTSAFGSLGLTILKDARVFGAPIAAAGHTNGFLAIGSMALPTATGRKVGCVMVKGPVDRITAYPRLIAEAVRGGTDLS